VLLLGRAVQAFGAGGIFPVAAAVIGDTFPEHRRGRALGLIGAVFGVAFLLGPLLGGVLLRFSWRWLFLVNLPLAAVVLWSARRWLPVRQQIATKPLDLLGIATLSVALAALALGISRLDVAALASSLGSATVWPFLAAALVCMPLFWLIESRVEDPVLRPGLLASLELKLIGVIALATGLAEAGMVFLPAMAVSGLGVPQATASFMLLPLVLTLIVGSPVAGRLLDSIGAKRVIQLGLLLSVSGLLVFGLPALTRTSFFAAGMLVGLGLSVLLGAPLRYVVIREAPAAERGAGQGLLTMFLSIGQLTGAALVGGVTASRSMAIDAYQTALLLIAALMSAAVVLSVALKSEATQRGGGTHRYGQRAE
jgi:MFS family permease